MYRNAQACIGRKQACTARNKHSSHGFRKYRTRNASYVFSSARIFRRRPTPPSFILYLTLCENPDACHTSTDRRIASNRPCHPVYGRSKYRSHSSSQLALLSPLKNLFHLGEGKPTADLNEPKALPRFSLLSFSSQHPAAAAVRPVTTVALVYASAVAAK